MAHLDTLASNSSRGVPFLSMVMFTFRPPDHDLAGVESPQSKATGAGTRALPQEEANTPARRKTVMVKEASLVGLKVLIREDPLVADLPR